MNMIILFGLCRLSQMALQLVPCSASFINLPSPMQQSPQQSPMQQSHSLSADGLMLLDIACSTSSFSSSYGGLQTATGGSGEGQTVPSSPTFSTWNYSPPSYWSDCSSHRSPSSLSQSTLANIKSEPITIQQPLAAVQTSQPSACYDSSLEELLDDYAFDYYCDSAVAPAPLQAPVVVKEEFLPLSKAAAKLDVVAQSPEQQQRSQQQGNALLRQCLRPAVDDYQQRCHLQFLNQVGTAAIAAHNQPQQQSMLLEMGIGNIKTENHSSSSSSSTWMNQQQQQTMTTGQGGPSQLSQNGTALGLASVLSLVMEQVNEEVRSTCEILAISPSKLTLQMCTAYSVNGGAGLTSVATTDCDQEEKTKT